MLELDHTKRIKASDALKHPFFNSIRNGEKLTSPIDDAAVSQSMTHYANMAYRTGKSFEINYLDGSIKDNKVKKIWSREYEKGWEINNVS